MVIVAAFMLLAAWPSVSSAEVHFTPVVAEVLAKPQPVPTSDGRRHLVYELLVTNTVRSTATLESVKAVGRGKVLASLSGDRLADKTIPFGADFAHWKPSRVLEPGLSGYILMDVSLPMRMKVPERLVHRFTVSLDPPSSIHAKTYRAAPSRVVVRKPPVIAPPLRGKRWVIGSGCCNDALNAHSLALVGLDGALYKSERFAIDFEQLTENGQIADGALNVFSNYPAFGAKVYSATRGKVVQVVRSLPEAPLGLPLPPLQADEAGGNNIVVKMPNGLFAFYAHLKSNSTRVKVGDRVKQGKLLGLLGNSGNSIIPHLHFHLMDGPDPFTSDGVPYRFKRFKGEGVVGNDFDPFTIGWAKLEPRLRGVRKSLLPMENQLIDFGR